MYGWKGRVGFINPSATSDTVPYEFYKIAPDGLQLVESCLGVRFLSTEHLTMAVNKMKNAVAEMALFDVDVIVLGGTPPMVLNGLAGYRNWFADLQSTVNVPIITVQDSAIEALQYLGARKLAVANPFEEEMNVKVKRFLEDSGFEVSAIKGLGIRRTLDESRQSPYAAYRLAKEVYAKASDADAVYLSCARWPTIGIIQELEADLQRPVVANIQAALWKVLQVLNLKQPISGYGRLLANVG